MCKVTSFPDTTQEKQSFFSKSTKLFHLHRLKHHLLLLPDASNRHSHTPLMPFVILTLTYL